ncbi:hypothetical protein QUF90_23940 [Desulfococcaceae bacterium HSG9]|nr:hypothetical protein [Desulfococcaceae bacterium HSG9]
MTANSLIQDCFFIKQKRIASKNKQQLPNEPTPVYLGKNVWVGTKACIIGGSLIDDDNVIAAGSVCYQRKIKKYSIGIGNPIIRALPIERLLKFGQL